jgi:hypothetical protein
MDINPRTMKSRPWGREENEGRHSLHFLGSLITQGFRLLHPASSLLTKSSMQEVVELKEDSSWESSSLNQDLQAPGGEDHA